MSKQTVPHTPQAFSQSGCTVKLLPLNLRAKQRGSLYHFYDGPWYDLSGVRTRDLLHERQTRLPQRQPDAVRQRDRQTDRDRQRGLTVTWRSALMVCMALYSYSVSAGVSEREERQTETDRQRQTKRQTERQRALTVSEPTFYLEISADGLHGFVQL